MSFNIINSGAYLRTAREFPQDLEKLNLQINKSWVDIANAVNIRVVGTYPTNSSAITGEEWFLTGNLKQQSLRQVYSFSAGGSIPHNIFTNIALISPNSYGTYIGTDGNFYGVIFSSNQVVIPNLVTFYVTPSVGSTSGNIVVLADLAAPPIANGIINLEWISAV